MKGLNGRCVTVAALLVQAASLAGCVLLAGVNSTADSHLVDDRGTGFNVTMGLDRKTIHVDLDSEQAVEMRLLWGATFGSNQGPTANEFDSAAAKWIQFQHPGCKVGQGRRIGLGSYEYDFSCPAEATSN
jgi:hypothetical protein